MFDQDGDHKWTMGPNGDDLHVEGPAFSQTGVAAAAARPIRHVALKRCQLCIGARDQRGAYALLKF